MKEICYIYKEMLNTSPISDESIVARTKFSIDCEKAETLIYFVISAWRKGGGESRLLEHPLSMRQLIITQKVRYSFSVF